MKPKPQYVFRRVNHDPIPHNFILWMKTRLSSTMDPAYLTALLQSAQANDEGYADKFEKVPMPMHWADGRYRSDAEVRSMIRSIVADDDSG